MKEIVVVVGGSSGMGLATASLLGKLGYEIVIASRSKEKLTHALHTIGTGTAHTLDITQEADLRRFFDTIGPFHHLVISAADFITGPFLHLEMQEARRFFDSKFWGQYGVAKYGAPKMHKGGSITFFSGRLSQKPSPNLSTAAAINAAIEGLTRALALELAPTRVNAIAPGTIATPIWDTVPAHERDAFFAHAAQTLPVGRIGKPDDIAQVVRFLIECTYITGDVIYCDGGDLLI